MLPAVIDTDYKQTIAIIRTKLQFIWVLMGLAFFCSLPIYLNDFWINFMVNLCITIIAVLGLHILTGLCGQISLAHSGMICVGAYTNAILISKLGVSAWVTLPLAGLSAGIVGLIFGSPSLRLKEFYLVVATLAAQVIIVWVVIHWHSLTEGSDGLYVKALSIGGIKLNTSSRLFYVALIITFFAITAAKNIQRSYVGRAFIAIRDNDLAAEAMGINLFLYKSLAFFIGCFYAGIAGWLWSFYMRSVNPEQFGLMQSMWLLGMIIVGGMGSTTGAVLGAILIRTIDTVSEILSIKVAEIYPAIGAPFFWALGIFLFGTIVAATLIYEPRGLYHRWEIMQAYWRLYPYSHK